MILILGAINDLVFFLLLFFWTKFVPLSCDCFVHVNPAWPLFALKAREAMDFHRSQVHAIAHGT